MLLPMAVGYLKMNSSKNINTHRRTPGHPVWHRNYYEHVIRNDRDLAAIREYITHNPAKWADDVNHPAAMSP